MADLRLTDLSSLDDGEYHNLVVAWNDTATELPDVGGVHELITAHAERDPAAVAVVYGNESLTYGDLETRANKLANHLRDQGVGPEMVVGLCLERGLDLAVAPLAVLKAGAAYLPLDPEYPPERLAFMLEDSRASVLIGQSKALDILPVQRARLLALDEPTTLAAVAAAPTESPDVTSLRDHWAYLIYTSGSTGRPKGVMLTHGSAINLVEVQRRFFEVGIGDVALQFAPISFDAAVAELFVALGGGATLCIANPEARAEPAVLVSLVRESGVSVATFPPSLLGELEPAELPGLRTVVSAGEALSRELAETWGNDRRLVNGYGLTETTVCTAMGVWDSEAVGLPSIGRPVDNVKVYVLDRRMRPTPLGSPGELFVGGLNIGRGYWSRPGLTAERFVADPFSSAGDRLYRTGDRARWRADGLLEFLGRLDDQVKVSGYRIEPGEVEAALAMHPELVTAAVAARGDGGERRLVAYVVPTDIARGAPPAGELRNFLAAGLPPHMVPSLFVEMSALPLSPNGKVDRSALPEPERSQANLATAYVSPTTATEEVVAEIWADLLGLERVGAQDDFFELGGRSLVATQVVSRLRTAFGVELALAELFANPTVSALASVVDETPDTTIAPMMLPTDRRGPIPASFAQQRLWFLNQLEPASVEYNVPGPVRLEGALDVEALRAALDALVERHETLRTRLVATDGVAYQVIDPAGGFALELVDLSGEPNAGDRAETMVAEDSARPFNFETGPLFWGRLLRIGPEDHILSLMMHHVVCDEWSAGLLREELATLYEAFRHDEPSPLAPLPVQYADFAVWQHDWLRGEVLEEQLAYWVGRLSGAPVIDLPSDRPRPPVRSAAGSVMHFQLPVGTADDLRSVAADTGASMFMTLLAGFSVLVGRYVGGDDVVLGTPIANRNRTEIEGLIGFFVNSLVIRTDLSKDPSFRDVVDRVRAEALAAYAHQDLPFERLVDALQPDRDRSRTPLFQIQFSYADDEADVVGSVEEQGLDVSPSAVPDTTAQFDLALILADGDDGVLNAAIEYSTELYDGDRIRRMADHFVQLMGRLGSEPDRAISGVPLLGEAEREELVVDINDNTEDHPVTAPVHLQIANQAATQPEAMAVECGDGSLSYHQLDQRANRLANYLRERGLRSDAVAAVALEPGPELAVAMLAVLKAGGAYLLLDPAQPKERLDFLLTDSGAELLVGLRRTVGQLSDGPTRCDVICLDDTGTVEGIDRSPVLPPGVGVHDQQLAYVVYTSGSTGLPKGVMVTHGALANVLGWRQRSFGLDESDRVLQHSAVTVDIATAEILWPLTAGARVIMAEEPARLRDVDYLLSIVESSRVTVIDCVPSLLNLLAASPVVERLNDLRLVICGGEVLNSNDVIEFYRRNSVAVVEHIYGQTESTIDVTSRSCERPGTAEGTLALGRPISNTSLYVLDPAMTPSPYAVPGEVFVGGIGPARGYLGPPALTAERFVADPFAIDGSRLYRTGDRGAWRTGPALEVLGRADDQLKVRGFRIEPEEVERTLLAHPGIARCVVAGTGEGSDRRLVAYVVPIDVTVGTPSVDELRRFVGDALPEFMVPSLFVELDRLPLLQNGKVDRGHLPEPDAVRPSLSGGLVVPSTPTEEVMAGLWAEVLGLENVGTADNFFDLGGHSLLATQIVSRLRTVFDVELALAELFDHPTVAGLAVVIDSLARGVAAPPIAPRDRRDEAAPLSFAQQRLWFIDQLEPGSVDYNVPEQLRFDGPLDAEVLRGALVALVERHEVLRTRFVAADGIPRQVVDSVDVFDLDIVDLTGKPNAAELAGALVAEDALIRFDLEAGRLFRARLIRLGPEEHVLSLAMHHVVIDEWSIGVLDRELSQLYEAFKAGEPSPLPPLVVQYGDFAVWQREWLQGEVLETQLGYWRERLLGAPALELPIDRARPAIRSSVGGVVDFVVPPQTVKGLRGVSSDAGATMFMTVLAAFKVLLGRYAGQDDIVVGTPIANRNRAETEDLIGFFINTLVLRTDLGNDPTFEELVGRVRQEALGAFAHQDLPFERLVDELQPERDRSRTPLFQVLFDYVQNSANEESEGEETAAEEPRQGGGAALYDLSLVVSDLGGERLGGVIQYSSELFDQATVEVVAERLLRVLALVAADPAKHLSELSLLADHERRRLTLDVNDTAANIEQLIADPDGVNHGVAGLIAAQSASNPDRPAVVCGDASLTHRELDSRAGQLAGYLRSLGIGHEDVVGVCVDRGIDTVIATLAVLRAGAAYLPIDPDYPVERIEFMLEDSGVDVVLVHTAFRHQLQGSSARSVVLDEGETERRVKAAPHLVPDQVVESDRLAAVVYTSGSTGRPKGVMITNSGLLAVLAGWIRAGIASQGSRWLSLTSFSFDVFTGDLLRALGTGGTLVVGPTRLLLSTRDLLDVLDEQRITAFECAPQFIDRLTEEMGHSGRVLERLERIVVTTDTWRESGLRRAHEVFGPDVKVFTAFGLTETTIDSTLSDLGRLTSSPETAIATKPGQGEIGNRPTPIGLPLANSTTYVLDADMSLNAEGIPGELYIGGAGVARGYRHGPASTAERFVADPFGADGTRLYRTGDRVQWRTDGELEFRERVDRQVNLRGYRIEPAEIQAALEANDELAASVVVADGDRLIAYVVATGSGAAVPPADELRSRLARSLPSHMVPGVVVELPELPITPNGKVDYEALPTPGSDRPEITPDYVAPRLSSEMVLTQMWAGVLGLDRIGVTDNFFDLGGHSLLATQVVARVREAFAVELALAELFDHPTVAELAVVVDGSVGTTTSPPIERADRNQPLPLSFAQQRLWFLDQLEPGSTEYNIPLALEFEGPFVVDVLVRALSAVVERHEVLRTRLVATEGVPYQLVDPPDRFALETVDVGDEPQPHQRAQQLVAEDMATPFNMENGPLFRARLVKIGPEKHLLSLSLHHIACDEWSVGVLHDELSCLYEAFLAEESSPLSSLPVQYADFAVWQREWLQGEVLDRQLDYWRDQLRDVPVIDLPTDRLRPAIRSSAGAMVEFEVPSGIVAGLRTISKETGATMFMTLLAAFNVLLGRRTGQDDIVVGTPIANRDRIELEGLIGLFVNTLVIRTDLSQDPTFAELLTRVRQTSLSAFANQDVPFEHLVEELESDRDRSRTPLFQVLFNYEPSDEFDGDQAEQPDAGGSGTPKHDIDTLTVAKFDLRLVSSTTTMALGGFSNTAPSCSTGRRSSACPRT